MVNTARWDTEHHWNTPTNVMSYKLIKLSTSYLYRYSKQLKLELVILLLLLRYDEKHAVYYNMNTIYMIYIYYILYTYISIRIHITHTFPEPLVYSPCRKDRDSWDCSYQPQEFAVYIHIQTVLTPRVVYRLPDVRVHSVYEGFPSVSHYPTSAVEGCTRVVP